MIRRMYLAFSLLLLLTPALSSTGSTRQTTTFTVVAAPDDVPELVQEKSRPVVHPAVHQAVESTSTDEPLVLWVFFTDKGIFSEGTYRKNRLEVQGTFSERAMRRRQKVDCGIDFTDFPVHPEYVRTITDMGATLRTTTRWFNGMSVEIPPELLGEIAALPFVREIRSVHATRRSLQRTIQKSHQPSVPGQSYQLDYGPSLGQLEQINVPAAHELGYSGAGVMLLMIGTGYNLHHDALQQIDLVAQYDFINGDTNTENESGDVRSQHDHGTATLSAAAGADPGHLYGPAYNASILLAKTEDLTSETPVEEDYWLAAIEWADPLGADIASSSLIYKDWYSYEDTDGNTAVITRAADMAAERGILVCNTAGNERMEDWFYIPPPADADSILACGAVDGDGLIAFFSSSGPTIDGRIKPEVCARGYYTRVADAQNPQAYYDASGTSYATPLVAGAAALVLEAHPDWTPMQIREALMMTADHAEHPDTLYGWGIIDVVAAINYTFGSMKGDVNGDGLVNIIDAVLTARIILHIIQPTPDQLQAADCTDDGTINVLDIICIARIILGKP